MVASIIIIIIIIIIIWFLQTYPKNVEYTQPYDKQITALQMQQDQLKSETKQEETRIVLQGELQEQIQELEAMRYVEQQKGSYIGRLGHFVEPVIRPPGFDWKIGISVLSGIAGKEVVVSKMAVIYHRPGNTDKDDQNGLIGNLQASTNSKGESSFPPLVAISFLIFILIYFPCIGVIATIRRESGSWKWALFTIFYTTGLAWLMSFMVYQLGSLII